MLVPRRVADVIQHTRFSSFAQVSSSNGRVRVMNPPLNTESHSNRIPTSCLIDGSFLFLVEVICVKNLQKRQTDHQQTMKVTSHETGFKGFQKFKH